MTENPEGAGENNGNCSPKTSPSIDSGKVFFGVGRHRGLICRTSSSFGQKRGEKKLAKERDLGKRKSLILPDPLLIPILGSTQVNPHNAKPDKPRAERNFHA